jgi:hypothetical protein
MRSGRTILDIRSNASRANPKRWHSKDCTISLMSIFGKIDESYPERDLFNIVAVINSPVDYGLLPKRHFASKY